MPVNEVTDLGADASVSDFLYGDDDSFAEAMGFAASEEAEAVEVTEEVGEQELEIPSRQAVRVTDKEQARAKKLETSKVPIPQDNGDEEEPEDSLGDEKFVEPVKEDKAVPPQKEGEEVEEEVEEEEKPALTKFAVRDVEGDEVEAPEIKLSFKANGKEYEDVPLDKVVLWAQMGVYNEQREEEVTAAKYFVQQMKEQNTQVEGLARQLQADLVELLEDETLYELARQEHFKHNSPEERARRAETQLQQRAEQERTAREQSQAQQYIATNIIPVVERLIETFPNIAEDEVMGRFNRLILPYLKNGVVPTQRLPEVKAVVERDLSAWAQQLEEARAVEKRKKAVEESNKQKQLTLAKRKAARATKPRGSVPGKEQKKPKQYDSVDAWLNGGGVTDIIEEALGQR